MIRLAKGGKCVFGWSRVQSDGSVYVPAEVRYVYCLEPCCRVVVLPGSRRSGGFCLIEMRQWKNSRLSRLIGSVSQAGLSRIPEGEAILAGRRSLERTTLREDGYIRLSRRIMEPCGIQKGDWLLSVRGSGTGPAFIVRGPLVQQARRHPGLASFSPAEADDARA